MSSVFLSSKLRDPAVQDTFILSCFESLVSQCGDAISMCDIVRSLVYKSNGIVAEWAKVLSPIINPVFCLGYEYLNLKFPTIYSLWVCSGCWKDTQTSELSLLSLELAPLRPFSAPLLPYQGLVEYWKGGETFQWHIISAEVCKIDTNSRSAIRDNTKQHWWTDDLNTFHIVWPCIPMQWPNKKGVFRCLQKPRHDSTIGE